MIKFLNELQMLFTGALGIMLRYAYMKRKDEQMDRIRVWTYFFISFGILILLIIYLSNKTKLFGYDLSDATKMIISAVGSLFSERFFIFMLDRDEQIFNKIFNKYFKNDK